MNEETQSKKAIVLLSGGMDSSVVLAMASRAGFEVHALTFDYGQRHRVEIEAAIKQARSQQAASHRVFSLNLSEFGGSALTTDQPVPKGLRDPGADSIPPTYVPARNTVFLSIALSLAEAIGAHDIFLGVSSVDYSGYPDCRPAYIDAFERLANLATRAADGGAPFHIHAPLLTLTKEQTVQAGLALGVDFSQTRTCYDPGVNGTPCGTCEACQLRLKAFSDAGLSDPLER